MNKLPHKHKQHDMRKWTLFIVIIITLAACKKEKQDIDDPSDYKLAPNTILIDEPTSQTLLQLDTTTLVFNGNTTQLRDLKQGNIIISGITPNAPHGYLRKILAVHKSGNQYTFSTEDATLTQAFEDLQVNYLKSFAINDTASGKKEDLQFSIDFPNTVVYDADGNNNTKHDQITLNGNVSFTPSILTQINIKTFVFNYAKIEASIESNIQSTLTVGGNIASVNKELTIFSKPLTPFMIPATPIVIVPYLRVNLGVDGSVNVSVTPTYTNTSNISAYIEYQNNTWTNGFDRTMNNSYNFSGLTASASIKGYVEPGIDFSFYGMRGATASIIAQGYMKLEASTPPSQCKLKAGVNAGIEAQLKIFGITFTEVSYPNSFGYEKTLFSCQPDTTQEEDDPIADFTASNTVITAGQSVQFTNLSANATTYQWSFAPQDSSLPNFSFQQNPPSVTYNYPGQFNVTLIAINQQTGKSNTKTKTAYIKVNPVPPISTGCGTTTSVTDIDGNTYPTLTIGNQCWLKENLKTSKYADGSPIANISDKTVWANTTSGAWCWYNDSAKYEPIYGKLYNWYTVNDSRKVCPAGWHVPSKTEWEELINAVGGSNVAAGHLKESGTTHWDTNSGADNSSNFTALPGGVRTDTGGSFMYLGSQGHWWSSTPDGSFAYQTDINTLYNYLAYPILRKSIKNGFSIRCVKD
jgi:uncharacterized protein (TIGR02145 family)